MLHIHGFSEWSTVNSERLPVAVVYPSNTKDVAEIVKICSKYRVPMSMVPSLPLLSSVFSVINHGHKHMDGSIPLFPQENGHMYSLVHLGTVNHCLTFASWILYACYTDTELRLHYPDT